MRHSRHAVWLVGLILGGCFLLPEEQEPLTPPQLFQEDEEVRYDTIEVQRVDRVDRASVQGRLTAARKADLYFRYQGGRLSNVRVEADDKVAEGDLLAELSAGNIQNQIEQRKVLLEKARISYEMLQVSKGNRYELALSALDVRLAELQLQDLEDTLDGLRLVAPFAGTVAWVDAKEGEYVQAYQPVIRIIDPTKLVLQCSAGSSDAAAFLRGTMVEVTVNGVIRQGKVIMTPLDAEAQVRLRDEDNKPEVMPDLNAIASSGSGADSDKSYILIDIPDLPRGAAPGDLGVAIRVVSRRTNVIMLPKDVISQYSGRTYVAVLKDGTVQDRDVELGLELGNEVEILQGLREGDRVVRR